MTTTYNLGDEAIRDMIRFKHTPVERFVIREGRRELWHIDCDECAECWPCTPIALLRTWETS